MNDLFKNKRRKYFNIYDDWVFHYMFSKDTAESKQALIALLNVILERQNDPIIDIQIKDPGFYGESNEDKDSILDIKAETDANEILDIEVQNQNLLHYPDRSVFYGGRMVNSALEKGEKYGKMKKSIVISIVNGTLFPDTDKLHTIFRLREIETGIQLSDRLELHFIELGKVQPNKPVEDMDSIEKLAAYVKYAGDETKENYVQSLIQEGGDAIKMAEHLFKELTEDEIAYERRERKLKFEHDYVTAMDHAKTVGHEQGLAEGLSQGLAEGAALNQISIVCKMFKKGRSTSEIAEILDMDFNYIQRICSISQKDSLNFNAEAIYQALKESEQ